MDILQIIILSLVQGFTEFLPISSSAHLILVPLLSTWQDQGLAFDVAVHIGSLCAVIAYFYKDIYQLLISWLQSCQQRRLTDKHSHLAWGIIFATFPTVIAGLLLHDSMASLRTITVIASTTIIFALLLALADKYGKKYYDEYQISWKVMLLIGCAQAIALIPGTSRSGITITAALLLGMHAKAAARFSFLLSIPVIIAAGSLLLKDLIQQSIAVPWLELSLAVVLSGLSAYFCIYYFLHFITRIGMYPFVIYRLLLGSLLFIYQ